jgi:hypothetical protein
MKKNELKLKTVSGLSGMILKTHYCLFFAYLILVSISGCKHSAVRVEHPFTVMEVDVTSNDEMRLSEVFKDFRVVRLETNDSVLLADIYYIAQANNRLYVTDRYAVILYVFDETGKFLSSIDRKGQGPGEYTGITQFTVDGENIVVMSRNQRKLIIYNESGEFISEHKVNCSALSISLLDDRDYALYCGNDRAGSGDKIHIASPGKTEKQFVPIDESRSQYLHYISPYNFFRGKDAVRFFEPYNDTVYTVTNDKIEPAFYIDFKGKNIPPSFFDMKHENIFTFSQSVMQHEYAAGVFRFAENEQTKMFITYYQWNKARLTLFDMPNKTSRTFSSVHDDVFFNSHIIPLNDFQYFAGENIIFPVSAATVAEWRENHKPGEKYKDIINAVDPDDNPALLIFNLK